MRGGTHATAGTGGAPELAESGGSAPDRRRPPSPAVGGRSPRSGKRHGQFAVQQAQPVVGKLVRTPAFLTGREHAHLHVRPVDVPERVALLHDVRLQPGARRVAREYRRLHESHISLRRRSAIGEWLRQAYSWSDVNGGGDRLPDVARGRAHPRTLPYTRPRTGGTMSTRTVPSKTRFVTTRMPFVGIRRRARHRDGCLAAQGWHQDTDIMRL